MNQQAEPAVAESPYSKLTTHSVERVLERSTRAPSWLDQVVQGGQFAHLKHSKDKKKRYVLLFEALTNTYLVAVLASVNSAVVTVLTLEQYEANHGTVLPVLRQLAQAARMRAVSEPEPGPSPEEQLATELTRRWNRRWHVNLRVASSNRRTPKIRISLDIAWRQECLIEQFAVTPRGPDDAQDARELSFAGQARLLGQSPKFLDWVVRQVARHGEDIGDLEAVAVATHSKDQNVDLTEALFAQLAA